MCGCVIFFFICYCSLAAVFISLTNVCQCGSPWVYPVWDSLSFLDLGGYFFPMLGKFSSRIWNIFSYLFFSSSSPGIPIILMLICLLLSQKFLRLSLLLFILHSLFCSAYFHHSIFQFTYLFFLRQYITNLSYYIVYCRLSMH